MAPAGNEDRCACEQAPGVIVALPGPDDAPAPPPRAPLSEHLRPSERLLTDAERAVLTWLQNNKGDTHIGFCGGRPHFFGYVYMAPKCHAATFLNLLHRRLITPEHDGWGAPPNIHSLPPEAMPSTREGGNVVRLRSRQPKLAQWFFRLSQMLSTDSVEVEPEAFALVLVGAGKMEILTSRLTESGKAQVARAFAREFAPGMGGLAQSYGISRRGEKAMEVVGVEDDIDRATAAKCPYRDIRAMLDSRYKLVQSLGDF